MSDLLGPGLNKLPAYYAFKFGSSELRDVMSVKEITTNTGVKGYEFQRSDRRIWVLWSLDGGDHSISLPGVPSAIYHVDGTPITPVGLSLTVKLEPLYLEWIP